jgi:hypothetical protein
VSIVGLLAALAGFGDSISARESQALAGDLGRGFLLGQNVKLRPASVLNTSRRGKLNSE